MINKTITSRGIHYHDGIGSGITILNEAKENGSYVSTNNIISEASLVRTLHLMKNKVFACISVFRNVYDDKYEKNEKGELVQKKVPLEENLRRNAILKKKMDLRRLGGHPLIGHWLAPMDSNDIEKYGGYENIPKDRIVDTVERSWMIPVPNTMAHVEFLRIIHDLCTIDGMRQDAVLFGLPYDIQSRDETTDSLKEYQLFFPNIQEITVGYYLMFPSFEGDCKNATFKKIATKMTKKKLEDLRDIEGSFSQHPKKDYSFVFEGIELPNGISGRQMFKHQNLKYCIFKDCDGDISRGK